MDNVILGSYDFEEHTILKIIDMCPICVLAVIEGGIVLKLYRNGSGCLVIRDTMPFEYVILDNIVYLMKKPVNFYC